MVRSNMGNYLVVESLHTADLYYFPRWKLHRIVHKCTNLCTRYRLYRKFYAKCTGAQMCTVHCETHLLLVVHIWTNRKITLYIRKESIFLKSGSGMVQLLKVISSLGASLCSHYTYLKRFASFVFTWGLKLWYPKLLLLRGWGNFLIFGISKFYWSSNRERSTTFKG